MRIFVAGATGALGIPLVRQLLKEGHHVTGLTRSETRGSRLRGLGATPVVVDALDGAALRTAVQHASPEIVVHALTALPKLGPRRPRDLRATNRVRSVGTRNLLEAAIAAGARRLVAESMMFVYGFGDLGADPIREDRPVASGAAAAWQTEAIRALTIEEGSIFEATDAGRIEGVVLRFGFFYGIEEGADIVVRKILHRTLPVPRRGVEPQSWIHVRDAAAATLRAIERGKPCEAYNVVDDQPARAHELMDALARELGAQPPLPVPLRMLRLIAPVLAAGFESSLSLSNAKAKDDLGWIPAFPTYREGVKEWASRLEENRSPGSEGWVRMDRHELLDRYEALGDERDFLAAKPLYEQALAEAPDAKTLLEYGSLLGWHGRHEIRRALAQFERAIELDPSPDKPHYQVISARAALFDTDEAIALYRQRLAASPGEVREHRFLASAYLAAHEYGQAANVVAAGFELAPHDPALTACMGEAKAGMGDPEGALADWRLALELDPEDIGPLYSCAFLLEREGRPEEAVEAWRSIIEWHEVRGHELQLEWPKRELERLRAALPGDGKPSS